MRHRYLVNITRGGCAVSVFTTTTMSSVWSGGKSQWVTSCIWIIESISSTSDKTECWLCPCTIEDVWITTTRRRTYGVVVAYFTTKYCRSCNITTIRGIQNRQCSCCLLNGVRTTKVYWCKVVSITRLIFSYEWVSIQWEIETIRPVCASILFRSPSICECVSESKVSRGKCLSCLLYTSPSPRD